MVPLDDERFDFYPEELLFPGVEDIPQSLLLNIIEKYKHIKDYCKWCFYKNNKQVCTVLMGLFSVVNVIFIIM